MKLPNSLPHGHGLSFARGMADGLVGHKPSPETQPEGHSASYTAGYQAGQATKASISKIVKK